MTTAVLVTSPTYNNNPALLIVALFKLNVPPPTVVDIVMSVSFTIVLT